MSLSTVQEIEQAIDGLAPQEMAELSEWLEEREQAFDARVASDFAAGRLDEIVRGALAEHRAGRTQPL